MLAEAFKIVSSVGGNIVESFTFTFRTLAWRFLSSRIHIAVVFELVVAKAFGFRAYHFAILPSFIAPREVKAIYRFL
jgi:hypothetical protein